MSSKIKVDTIENVAGSGNVSLGSGHNLVLQINIFSGNVGLQWKSTIQQNIMVEQIGNYCSNNWWSTHCLKNYLEW